MWEMRRFTTANGEGGKGFPGGRIARQRDGGRKNYKVENTVIYHRAVRGA
jgi:hypothetical protein